jgi:hypothetical protein
LDVFRFYQLRHLILTALARPGKGPQTASQIMTIIDREFGNPQLTIAEPIPLSVIEAELTRLKQAQLISQQGRKGTKAEATYSIAKPGHDELNTLLDYERRRGALLKIPE